MKLFNAAKLMPDNFTKIYRIIVLILLTYIAYTLNEIETNLPDTSEIETKLDSTECSLSDISDKLDSITSDVSDITNR